MFPKQFFGKQCSSSIKDFGSKSWSHDYFHQLF